LKTFEEKNTKTRLLCEQSQLIFRHLFTMAEVSLPKELGYGLPPTLAGITSYEYRVATYTNLAQWQPGSTAQLQLGQMPNTYFDPSTAYISMRVRVNMTVRNTYTGSANTAPKGYLIGSGWSFINRASVYFNSGVLLDDMQQVNIASNTMRNLFQDQSSKIGDSVVWGSTDALIGPNVGVPLCGTAPYNAVIQGTNAYQFLEISIPMMGYMGQGSAGKLIPAFVGPHRIDLQMEQIANIFVGDGTDITAITGISVDRLEFVCQAIRLSDEMQRVVESALPNGGQMSIRSNQIIASTIPIPAATSGSQMYLNGTRAQSVKALIHTFNYPALVDKIFGSVNPNASQITLDLNGVLYPQQSGDLFKPSDSYARLLQAIGVFSTVDGKPCFGGQSFYRAQTAATTTNGMPLIFAGPVADAAASYTTGNCFYHFIDVESFGSKGSGSGFFSGQSTVGTGSFLKIQFALPTAVASTCYAFALCDCVVTYDLASRTAIRRF
jgi:hypothetical protein